MVSLTLAHRVLGFSAFGLLIWLSIYLVLFLGVAIELLQQIPELYDALIAALQPYAPLIMLLCIGFIVPIIILGGIGALYDLLMKHGLLSCLGILLSATLSLTIFSFVVVAIMFIIWLVAPVILQNLQTIAIVLGVGFVGIVLVTILFSLLRSITRNVPRWQIALITALVTFIVYFRNLFLVLVKLFYDTAITPLLTLIGPVLAELLLVIAAVLSFLFSIASAIIALIVKYTVPVALIGLIVTSFVGLLALLGKLLIDDFVAAWNSGSGLRGVFLASFGIGLTASLLMVAVQSNVEAKMLINETWAGTVSAGNEWQPAETFRDTIPPQTRTVIDNAFENDTLPIFDALLFNLVVGIAFLVIARGFDLNQEDRFHVSFVSREGILLILIIPSAVMIAFVAALVLANLPQTDSE